MFRRGRKLSIATWRLAHVFKRRKHVEGKCYISYKHSCTVCETQLDKKITGILVAASVLMLAFAFSSPVYAPSTNTCTSFPTYGGSFFNCIIYFESGWNLISSPVVPFSGVLGVTTYSSTVNGIFGQSIAGNLKYVTSVYTYSNTKASWTFCTVGHTGTGSSETWSCPSLSIVGGNGYWVYCTSSFSVTISGYVIPPAGAPPSYAVVKGWNLVGFEPISAMSTSPVTSETYATYFASLTGLIVTSYAYCNSAGMACTPTGAYLTAPSTLYVGQGVWVNLNAPATFSPA